jgi:DNA-binding protein HU-beta
MKTIMKSARMTKSGLVRELAARTGVDKNDVALLIEDLSVLAKKEIRNNGEFPIPDIGKLVKVDRKARMGRNPSTGETINIPAKIVVKFRFKKSFRDTCLEQ